MSEDLPTADAAREISRLKRTSRPDIDPNQWGRDQMSGRSRLCIDPVPDLPDTGTIARVRYAELTHERFVEEFEEPCLPAILLGVTETDGWPVTRSAAALNEDRRPGGRWALDQLRARFGEVEFKCGVDSEDDPLKTKLKYFIEYLKTQQDDSPLYVFDHEFADHPTGKELLADYRVPRLFQDDLLDLVGEEEKPNYRWFLLGPRRSGSEPHIDPLATSAWNTLVSGHKRWALFKPGTRRSLVKGSEVRREGESDDAIFWFETLLPRIKQQIDRLPGGNDGVLFEVTQRPGETIFVPGGWWHAVLNLEDSVAITQNYVSPATFPQVWRSVVKDRKDLAELWLRRLREERPDVARIALESDEAAGLVDAPRPRRRTGFNQFDYQSIIDRLG